MRMILAALLLLLAAPLQAGSACVEGVAAGYACSHVDFVGRLTAAELGGSGEALNDIWGWVDPNSGEEYALVGMQDGTAFVRITGTGSLVPLGRLPASDGQVSSAGTATAKMCHDELCGEQDSAWRDIKVFGNYAYIVSEAEGHGLQIFDLTRLRAVAGPSQQVWNENGHYGGIRRAHNIFINESTAHAYIVGHDRNTTGGGIHVLDLSSPTAPRLLADLRGDGYTHDVQCVVYDGADGEYLGHELCFASNEDTVTVWDVTGVGAQGAAGTRIVSRTPYSESGYTHQGWLSEDHRYFFLNDELDEINTGVRTHLRVLDVSDVDAPVLAADYFAPTAAIDHNNYVHGRWLYQSNYGAGLRILDILDPEHPVEAAYFDMQASDIADFYGTWSNYVFPTGYVAVTDINGGLFVVKPTLDTATTSPDVTVEITLDEGEAGSGVEVSGEIVVANGAAAPASDVLLTAHLPGAAAFSAFSAPTGWQCGAPARVVSCQSDAMPASSNASFAFTLTSSLPGEVDAYAMAYANEADAAPADNLDSSTLSVKPAGGSAGGGATVGGGGAGSLAFLFLALALHARRVRR